MILNYTLFVIFIIVPFASAHPKQRKIVKYVRIVRPNLRIITDRNKPISTKKLEPNRPSNGNNRAEYEDATQIVTKRKQNKSAFKAVVTDRTTLTTTFRSSSYSTVANDSIAITETKNSAAKITAKRNPVKSAAKITGKRNPVKSAAKTAVKSVTKSVTKTISETYFEEIATGAVTEINSEEITTEGVDESYFEEIATGGAVDSEEIATEGVDDIDSEEIATGGVDEIDLEEIATRTNPVKYVVTSSTYRSPMKYTIEPVFTSVVDSNPLKLPVINRKLANPKSSSDNLGEDEMPDTIDELQDSSKVSGDDRPLIKFTILSVITWIAAFYIFF